MAEYSKVNIKLTDRQLKRLETAVEEKARATLRMSLKMFDGNASWNVTDNKTKNKAKKCI